MQKDIERIAAEIKIALAKKHMNCVDAAGILGISSQAFYNQLTRPFTRKTAMLYSKTFGFNPEFLLTGEGTIDGSEQECSPSTEQKMSYLDLQNIIRDMAESNKSQQETIAFLTRILTKKRTDDSTATQADTPIIFEK